MYVGALGSHNFFSSDIMSSINAYDSNGHTPLLVAAARGDLEGAKKLLQQGAQVNKKQRGAGGLTPLHTVAIRNRVNMINALIKAGATVNSRDGRNRTPLMHAAQRGKRSAVAALLAAGANKNAKDSNGKTALYLAAEARNGPIMNALINAGAEITPNLYNNSSFKLHMKSRPNVKAGQLALMKRNAIYESKLKRRKTELPTFRLGMALPTLATSGLSTMRRYLANPIILQLLRKHGGLNARNMSRIAIATGNLKNAKTVTATVNEAINEEQNAVKKLKNNYNKWWNGLTNTQRKSLALNYHKVNIGYDPTWQNGDNIFNLALLRNFNINDNLRNNAKEIGHQALFKATSKPNLNNVYKKYGMNPATVKNLKSAVWKRNNVRQTQSRGYSLGPKFQEATGKGPTTNKTKNSKPLYKYKRYGYATAGH